MQNFNFDFISNNIVKNIEIVENNNFHKIISKENILKEELIYWIELDEISDQHTIQITLNQKTYKINVDNHTYRINNKNYFTFFDCFMNHSCEPNTKLILENNKCLIYAIKNINCLDELTCDYNEDIKELSKLGKITITNIFNCNCQSKNCKKIIYC